MGVSKSYILIWIWNNEAERAVLYLRIVVFTPQVLAFAALTPPQQSFRGINTAATKLPRYWHRRNKASAVFTPQVLASAISTSSG